MKYDNPTKAQARGWAWNRIAERIRGSFNRKRARVYCLIGDTTHELEVAEAKGFSRLNVIGVDIRKEPVEMWRAAGGLAIQAPIDAVLLFSKIKPQAVIADFCGGLNEASWGTWEALSCVQHPGCIVMNLLRGRDKIKQYRPDPFLDIVKRVDSRTAKLYKKRPMILLSSLFCKLFGDVLFEGIDDNDVAITRLATDKKFFAHFMHKFDEFIGALDPQFYEYKSADSFQWFDSIAINSCVRPESALPGEYSEEECTKIKRRLAALEAVRTQRLNALPDRRRLMVEPLEKIEVKQKESRARQRRRTRRTMRC